MSNARTDYSDKLVGATLEIVSAISALNMPDDVENPEGEYLSEKYKWAIHAMTHLEAALQLLRQR